MSKKPDPRFTIEEQTPPEEDDRDATSSDGEVVLEFYQTIHWDATNDVPPAGTSKQHGAFYFDTDASTLIRKTYALLALYVYVTLIICWVFFRSNIGRVTAIPCTFILGALWFILLFLLCAVKKKSTMRKYVLVVYLCVQTLFLSFLTSSSDSDFIPRVLFTLFVSKTLTTLYTLLIPQACMNTIVLLNLLWAVTGHTMLSSSSPEVAARTSIETTVFEFCATFIMIGYQLFQIKAIPRLLPSQSPTKAIVHYCVDVPSALISSACCCIKK